MTRFKYYIFVELNSILVLIQEQERPFPFR